MRARHLLFVVFVTAGSISLAQIPEYWFLDEVNPGQDISLYADGANVQDGSFSCMMTLEQPEVPYLISDNFEVTAGEEYTFSIHYYDNDNRGTLKFYSDFYDAQGEDIYGLDPVESMDNDSWQEVTWSGTVPDGAVHGYILIKFYDEEGYVDEAIGWVDNVSFMVNGENKVLNGSFESWPGVGIQATETISLEVAPNPVTNRVEISNIGQADRLEIRNMLGQLVIFAEVDHRESILLDLSGLEEGLYMATTIYNNQVANTVKVIKR